MRTLTILQAGSIAATTMLVSVARAQCEPVLSDKLVPPTGADEERFGDALALSGSWAAVGVPREGALAPQAGAVQLYRLDQGAWLHHGVLRAPDGAAGDRFGSAVALNGDILVVGAPWDVGAGPQSGSCSVFIWTGGAWTYETRLSAPDGGDFDWFGSAVAVDGERIAIGAPFHDEQSGAVYVFARLAGAWALEVKLTVESIGDDDRLGSSVAIDGETVLAGAPEDDTAALTAGSATVFVRTESGWSVEEKLLPPAPRADDGFGAAVALDGDLALVGAPRRFTAVPAGGGALLYRRNVEAPGAWSFLGELTAEDAAIDDRFGWSVALSGNLALVGAWGSDAGALNAGATYLFHRNVGGPDGWEQVARLTAFDGALADRFGGTVALDGQSALVGAAGDDEHGEGSGAAYGFHLACDDGCPADLNETDRVDATDLLLLLARWGTCLACGADIDGDGTVGTGDLLELLAAWGPC